jgi:hypothetical protein
LPDDDKNVNKFKALIHIIDCEFVASKWRAFLLGFVKKFQGENFYDFCLLIEKIFLSRWVKSTRKDKRYSDYSRRLTSIHGHNQSGDVLKQITYTP